MDDITEKVTAFHTYARRLLEEQELQLNNAKGEHLLSGKLARIKIFNEHLEILKGDLQKNMEAALVSCQALPAVQFNKLKTALSEISTECINEYLCVSFIKGKD